MEHIRIDEIMTLEVATCSPDEPLLDVVKQLASRKFSCLVIIEDNIPLGIVTERDLVEVLCDTLQGVTWDELAIKNFMTSPVITISEDMMLSEAVILSHTKKIRHMPVVSAVGDLVGILTQTNIVAGFYESTY